MSIHKYLSEQTAIEANYETPLMPNFTLRRGQPGFYQVYDTQIHDTELNMFIGELVRPRKNGKGERIDYFLATYEGKHSGQVNTEEEAKPYMDAMELTFRRKNRINARDIERKVKQILARSASKHRHGIGGFPDTRKLS